MKIAVVGAGIIGITTAWELAQDGHAVTVLERRSAAAEESSFANAGVVAPGYVTPWAAPGMPLHVLRHLFSRHAPVHIGLPLSARELAWMWRWWRACTPATYGANRARLHRLAFYSRQRLQALTDELQLEYDRSEGYLVLLRSEQEAQRMRNGLQVLRDAGVVVQEIDEAQARRLEPALNPDTPFLGALHLPQDGVGNCRQFALLLKNQAQRSGVQFEFNTCVTRIDPSWQLGIEGQAQPRSFDAVVVCAGAASAPLLAHTGLRIPLVGVHGYSVSAPVREPLNAPRSAIMDERYKVAISRLGQRVRVAGMAQIGGRAPALDAGCLQTLYKVLHDWFPGAARMSGGVQEWKGARPMLPDGPPLIGASGRNGLWLNLGHGSSGWALACGSARALADLVAGRTPDIDLEGLGIERLQA
jgi:D-amino-acid dehydrogenase